MIGLFTTFFIGMFTLIARKNSDWTPVMVFGGIFAALFLMLQVLRLKVGPDGFVYRTLMGSKAFDFDDISKGFFTVTISGSTPQGMGNFCVETKDGQKSEINLRLFVT